MVAGGGGQRSGNREVKGLSADAEGQRTGSSIQKMVRMGRNTKTFCNIV